METLITPTYCVSFSKAHSEPGQTSKMELIATIFNDFMTKAVII